jgi:protein-tyrosine-phosphatase
MKTVISESTVPAYDIRPLQDNLEMLHGLAGVEAKAREATKRQTVQWFDWMDAILSIHRSNYVFREATPAQLAEHKTALSSAIEYRHLVKARIDDPWFNEPDLVSRLQVRIQQLQDAYDTCHDTTLSDAQANEILKQVFPE